MKRREFQVQDYNFVTSWDEVKTYCVGTSSKYAEKMFDIKLIQDEGKIMAILIKKCMIYSKCKQ